VPYHSHNLYLTFLAETGLLGLLAILSLFFLYFWQFFKIWSKIIDKLLISASFASVIFLLLANLMDEFSGKIWLIFVLILSIPILLKEFYENSN